MASFVTSQKFVFPFVVGDYVFYIGKAGESVYVVRELFLDTRKAVVTRINDDGSVGKQTFECHASKIRRSWLQPGDVVWDTKDLKKGKVDSIQSIAVATPVKERDINILFSIRYSGNSEDFVSKQEAINRLTFSP